MAAMAMCWADVGPDADERRTQTPPTTGSDMGEGRHIPHLALLMVHDGPGNYLYSLGQRWEGGQESPWLLDQLPAQ